MTDEPASIAGLTRARVPGWRQGANMAVIVALSALASWLISPWVGFVLVSLPGVAFAWLAGAMGELIDEYRAHLTKEPQQ